MDPLILIGAIGTIGIAVLAIVARMPSYHVAPAFLIPLQWLPYFLRRRIFLHPLHYALFTLAILLHMTGAFGFYQHSPFYLSFDIYVHFYFAFAVTFMLHRLFGRMIPARRWFIFAMSLMFMMGFGALHEIMEYMSYLLLGEAKGMLKPSTSYFFDTQRDLTNNLLGTITALLVIAIFKPAANQIPDLTCNPPPPRQHLNPVEQQEQHGNQQSRAGISAERTGQA
jgi:uncharacterized membrane protein YjdF